MKKRQFRYYALYCILIMVVSLCGCGTSQTENVIKQEDSVYVSNSLLLPEYGSFDDAWSDGDKLYYVAGEYGAEGQYQAACYAMEQEGGEPERLFSLPENQMALALTGDEDGNLCYLALEIVPQDSGSQMTMGANLFCKVSPAGESLLNLNLRELVQEQTHIQHLAVDGEGHIVLAAGNQNIFVLNPDGSLLFETRVDGRVYDLCRGGNEVYVGYDNSGMALRQMDIPGKGLGRKLNQTIPGHQFWLTDNRKGNLLIATEESVYQYTAEKEEITKKFDWQTYDSMGIVHGTLASFGEEDILALSWDYANTPVKAEGTMYRQAAAGEEAMAEATNEKTVLTLGIPDFLPEGLRAEVVMFNKINQDIQIEIVTYEGDSTRFYTEITAGESPDLLILPSREMELLTGGGVLEDLNPYFNRDETLNRSDFLENILDAFEKSGHLYGMPVRFDILTMVGRTSALKNQTSWNLDELISYVENAPEEADVFINTSKSSVLNLLKTAYTNELVNIDYENSSETMDGPINRELLEKMLVFANQYENDEGYLESGNLTTRIREESEILIDVRVRVGHAYFGSSRIFGEPVTYVGFPSAEGSGNLIQSFETFAISARSEHKDIAWKFISMLLSKDSQMRMEESLSLKGFFLRKDVLEYHLEWVKENTSAYLLLPLSTSITDGNLFPSCQYTNGDVQEEDIAQVRNLIENADRIQTISPDIDQIIGEEATFYFDGTKPLEEVMDVIENRVRTYVNEMK